MAVKQEVVAHGQQDVGVGLDREATEQLGKARLLFGRVQREQLLELIEDQHGLGVALAPTLEERDGHVRLAEVDELLDGFRVTGELAPERTRDGRKRTIARSAADVTPAFRQRRNEPRPEQRALARSGGADDREQPRPAQLGAQRLDLRLPAEEMLRVGFREGRQPGIRVLVLRALDTKRDLFQGAHQRSGRGIAISRVRRHGSPQHRRPGAVGRLGRLFANASPQVLSCLALLDAALADHLGQDDSCGKDVRPGVHGITPQLLREPCRRACR